MCECDRLRAVLDEVTGLLSDLIEAGKFPGIGRSYDEKSANLQWWDDHRYAIDNARRVLGHMSETEWIERYG